jgi:hypothetical protein
MSWQIVRGPSGKMCFELDAERGLVRLQHSKKCIDIVDLTAYGLIPAGRPDEPWPLDTATKTPAIDFSPNL